MFKGCAQRLRLASAGIRASRSRNTAIRYLFRVNLGAVEHSCRAKSGTPNRCMESSYGIEVMTGEIHMKCSMFDVKMLTEALKDKNHFVHSITLDEDALFLWYSRILTRDGRLVNELQGYSLFQSLILERVLGYDHRTLQSSTGIQRKADFALGQEQEPPRCVIEAKGLGTDLWKIQAGRTRAESPIDQARAYARNQQAPYCTATDYNLFVLCPFSAPDTTTFEISIEELFCKKSTAGVQASELSALSSDVQQVKYLREHLEIDRTMAEIFLSLFHRKSFLDERLVDTLRETEFKHRYDLTKEFYTLFHETRLQLVWEVRCQNSSLDLKSVVHIVQLILNRWLFVCFAEARVGKGLLPPTITDDTLVRPILQKRVLTSRQGLLKSELVSLFRMLMKGESLRGVYDYNGGLFEEDIETVLMRDWISPKDLEDLASYCEQPNLIGLLPSRRTAAKKRPASLFERIPKLETVILEYLSQGVVIHPVWLNLIKMASYDFQEEISVEMMGHVFEQSISDIERIIESAERRTLGRRKEQGIYYTPDFITDYITRHAICTHLLKKIDVSPTEPVLLAQDVVNAFLERSDLDTLEELLGSIRILDPACGSGAFLNKAVDVLLEFHQRVKSVRQEMLQAVKTTKTRARKRHESDKIMQLELTSWLSDLTNQVLLNNIYGVDINEESVLITRLSLFLKILSTEKRKLPALDDNILVGNSVVSDIQLEPSAFDWAHRFGSGKFDVIISNPPYVKLQNLDKGVRKALENEYQSVLSKGNYDLYLPFIYRGRSLLTEKGVLGYIVPNKLFVTDYAKQLVALLVREQSVQHIVDFTWEQVFNDATTYTALIFLASSEGENEQLTYYQRVTDLDAWKRNVHDLKVNKAECVLLNEQDWSLLFKDEREIVEMMRLKGRPLGEGEQRVADVYVGLQTSADEVYVLDYETDTNSGTKVRSAYLQKSADKGLSSMLVLEEAALKPLMMGQDIHRYEAPKPERRLVFPYELKTSSSTGQCEAVPLVDEELRRRWPETHKYLSLCRERLAKRYEADRLPDAQWFKYVYDKNLDMFESKKLICQVLSSRCNFVFDEEGRVFFPGSGGGSGGYGVSLRSHGGSESTRDDYLELLAVLNSMVADFFVKLFSSKFQRGFFSYSKMYLDSFPVVLNSVYRPELVKLAEELIGFHTLLRMKASSFDRWISTVVPGMSKSFSIAGSLGTSEDEFGELVHRCHRNVSTEELANAVGEFTKTKQELIKLKYQIVLDERRIDDCVFSLFGLDVSLDEETGKTHADVIKAHPFIRYFGGYPH